MLLIERNQAIVLAAGVFAAIVSSSVAALASLRRKRNGAHLG